MAQDAATRIVSVCPRVLISNASSACFDAESRPRDREIMRRRGGTRATRLFNEPLSLSFSLSPSACLRLYRLYYRVGLVVSPFSWPPSRSRAAHHHPQAISSGISSRAWLEIGHHLTGRGSIPARPRVHLPQPVISASMYTCSLPEDLARCATHWLSCRHRPLTSHTEP